MKKTVITAMMLATAAMAAPAHAQFFAGDGVPSTDAAFSTPSVATFTTPNQTFTSYSEAGMTISAGRIDNTFADQYNSYGSYYENDEGALPQITVNFAAPTSAFAFNWGAADIDWTLDVYDGASLLSSETISPTYASNDKNYFGYAGSNITDFVLTTSDPTFNDYVFVDNVTFNAVAGAVPEPATWAMLLVGFGFIGVCVRRNRRVRVTYS